MLLISYSVHPRSQPRCLMFVNCLAHVVVARKRSSKTEEKEEVVSEEAKGSCRDS
jgi:hypothetical protein